MDIFSGGSHCMEMSFNCNQEDSQRSAHNKMLQLCIANCPTIENIWISRYRQTLHMHSMQCSRNVRTYVPMQSPNTDSMEASVSAQKENIYTETQAWEKYSRYILLLSYRLAWHGYSGNKQIPHQVPQSNWQLMSNRVAPCLHGEVIIRLAVLPTSIVYWFQWK